MRLFKLLAAVLVGLHAASCHPVVARVFGRTREPVTPAQERVHMKQLREHIFNGYSTLYRGGGLRVGTDVRGAVEPSFTLPGGIPELRRHRFRSSGKQGTPGHPRGPRKKTAGRYRWSNDSRQSNCV